jgi:hypothetical protein
LIFFRNKTKTFLSYCHSFLVLTTQGSDKEESDKKQQDRGECEKESKVEEEKE